MRYRTTPTFPVFALLIATALPQLALAGDRIAAFDPPGAGKGAGQGTFPIQNLNSGAIVGYYVDATNVAHGFIRSAHGKYTIIDVPGAVGTQAFGINDEGTVVGWWFDAAGMYHGYLRDDDGNFTTFDVPGAAPSPPQKFPGAVILFPLAINRRGTVTGSYVDANSMAHCFVRSLDGNITSPIDPPNSINTLGDTSGINRAGAISGGYVTGDGVTHGFVRDPEGGITSFDGPDAGTMNGTGTIASMINDAGTIPGGSIDNNSVFHGFIRSSDGAFVTVDVAGAGTGPPSPKNVLQGTIEDAMNLEGTSGGNYVDSNYVSHGFVRSRHGKITTFDVPGEGSLAGQGVVAIASINDEGAVVGWYVDANGANHGFLYRLEDEDD